MKPKPPRNDPTLTCEVCGVRIPPSIKWANNDQGDCFPVHMDIWGEYYLDIQGHRHEFCSPTCVLIWRKSQSDS